MRDLKVGVIECDEQWDFIGKKQKRAAMAANVADHIWTMDELIAATTEQSDKLAS